MEIIESILDLIKRGKILPATILLVLLASALMFYESLTAAFTLSRLEKSAELLSKLQEISTSMNTNSAPVLDADFRLLRKQASEAIRLTPLPSQIPAYLGNMAGPDFIWKFILGSAWVWLVGAIALATFLAKTPPSAIKEVRIGFWNIAKAISQVGLVYGFIAVWFPKVYWFNWWPLFHIIACPILITLLIGIVLALFIKPERDLATGNNGENNREKSDV